MTHNIEVYGTCGGITLAETDITPSTYATVSTEAPEYLTVYRKTDDEPHLPEDMIFSAEHDDLDPKLQELHAEMVEKLKASK